MTKSKQTAKIDVEALLAKKGQITNQSIQSALAKAEKEKQEKDERELLGYISHIQSNTASAVEGLRDARKKEKKCKDFLTALAEAEQQFYTDADIEKYNASHTAAVRAYRGY